jgi:ATP synthase protein I
LSLDQRPHPKIASWEDSEHDNYRVYSKAELDALRLANPKKFASINSWRVILAQITITALLGVLWGIFTEANTRSVYTYSALVGGLIGFLPSALFLLRLTAAKKNSKSNSGGYLAAVVSGEFIKILATFLLFIGFALKQPDLKWIPLLVTYLATLQCYLLAWFWK